jgi:hypothetical protein
VRDTTPQAVQSCHELIGWLMPQLDKLPRLRQFTLGERLELALLEVLELLLEAASTRNNQAALQRANLRLEVARHLWRLAHAGIPPCLRRGIDRPGCYQVLAPELDRARPARRHPGFARAC